MARDFSAQLAGQIGEALVVAELGRRDIIATAFSGNVPDIDILAYKNGISLAVQVKAWRSGSVSFNARRFLNIDQSGDVQTIIAPQKLDPNLIYIFVMIGSKGIRDRFFILTQGELQSLIESGYGSFLGKHNGVRPKNSETTHTAISLIDLDGHEDEWGKISSRFSVEVNT